MASRRINDLSALDWDDSALIKAYNKGMSLRVKDFELENSKDRQTKDDKNDNKREWRVGDFCRAVYPHDNLVYEAKIVDIIDDMCTVDFLGYNEEIMLELESLTKSKGKLVRKKQIKNAKEYNLDASADESASADDSRNEYSGSEHSVHRRRDMNPQNHTMNHSTHYGAGESTLQHSMQPAHMKLQRPYATGTMPIPPVPPMVPGAAQDPSLCAMMSAWYMAGYYTGLHEGQKAQCSPRCCRTHNCCQPTNNFCHH